MFARNDMCISPEIRQSALHSSFRALFFWLFASVAIFPCVSNETFLQRHRKLLYVCHLAKDTGLTCLVLPKAAVCGPMRNRAKWQFCDDCWRRWGVVRRPARPTPWPRFRLQQTHTTYVIVEQNFQETLGVAFQKTHKRQKTKFVTGRGAEATRQREAAKMCGVVVLVRGKRARRKIPSAQDLAFCLRWGCSLHTRDLTTGFAERTSHRNDEWLWQPPQTGEWRIGLVVSRVLEYVLSALSDPRKKLLQWVSYKNPLLEIKRSCQFILQCIQWHALVLYFLLSLYIYTINFTNCEQLLGLICVKQEISIKDMNRLVLHALKLLVHLILPH